MRYTPPEHEPVANTTGIFAIRLDAAQWREFCAMAGVSEATDGYVITFANGSGHVEFRPPVAAGSANATA